MKRFLAVCLSFLLLSACGRGSTDMEEALSFRESLLRAEGCVFQGKIAADYGDELYSFTVQCSADREGNITFTVIEPESISGISGRISASGGCLTFDDTVLGFPLLADGELSPVSAPWIFLSSLRGGYMTSCARDSDGMRLCVNDSYEDDALMLDIWFHESVTPYYAEILWQGRRVLTLELDNFEIL